MAKAKEFLQAARLALANGFLNACVQDCYYAMFWAIVVMLEWTDQRRVEWSHGELRRYFGLVLVKQWHLCPAGWNKRLEVAYDLRLKAAYGRESAFKNQAEHLLRYAAEFVRKAEKVLK